MLKGAIIGGLALGMAAAMSSTRFMHDYYVQLKTGRELFLRFTNADAATKFNRVFYQISRKQQSQIAAPIQNAPLPTSDPYEEIKKLKSLLDAGIITQPDFDAKKKQTLEFIKL